MGGCGRAHLESLRGLGHGKFDRVRLNRLRKCDYGQWLGAAVFPHPTGEPGFDLRLDPFLHHLVQFFAQIRDAVQASELERFQGNFGSASKVLDGRLG